MIVGMKKITFFTMDDFREDLLLALRNLGVVHIESGSSPVVSEDAESISGKLAALKTVEQAFEDSIAVNGKPAAKKTDFSADALIGKDFAAIEDRKRLFAELRVMESQRDTAAFWGDFDPSALSALSEKTGLKIVFVQKASMKSFPADFIRLKDTKDGSVVAVTCQEELLAGMKNADEVKTSLVDSENRIIAIKKQIKGIDDALYADSCGLDACRSEIKKLERQKEFVNVRDGLGKEGDLVYFSGYVPETAMDGFGSFAQNNPEMGYVIDEVSEDDNPPTLLKNGKFGSLIKPVIDILGLFPGYRERDISFWFTAFFSVFFAFIIGDAAYGLIFVAVGALLAAKQKKITNTTALVLFLGVMTVIWGAMTGTWFGSEAVLNALPFLKKLVVPKLSNFPELFGLTSEIAQNSMMRLCFTIGAGQLLLACAMNVIYKSKSKNLSLFADIGWFLIIGSLYFVVLLLLVGNPIRSIAAVIGAIAVGFLLLVLFGGQQPGVSFVQGLKAGLGGLFTTFLNVISAFGNVMSYIRLFAVGMASVAIAQSFNGIAGGLLHGALIPAGIIILVIGHALNLVMGLLSVIVHGVRLNVMEFSNQLGLEWSGYEYHPFR